ncbi:MAG: DUF4956 domain-containing protein [Planctomycetota bacterium]
MPTWEPMLHSLYSGQSVQLERLAYCLLIAFIVGQLNAWCYMWTHRGMSYSRSFTQALIIITLASSLSMSIVATNVIAAFGLIGGLSMIRFRTVVRDARDSAYVLLSLVCGIGCGFGFYAVAVIGSAVTNAIAIYLHRVGFGSWQSLESLLRMQIEPAALENPAFETLLKRFCRAHSVLSVDETPGAGSGLALCQCAFKVQLRDPECAPDFISALRADFGVSAVRLLVHQENEDVS